jgi:hypothetical protein
MSPISSDGNSTVDVLERWFAEKVLFYALIRKAQVDAIVDDNGLESFEVKP